MFLFKQKMTQDFSFMRLIKRLEMLKLEHFLTQKSFKETNFFSLHMQLLVLRQFL
jgi:hypothetical protein